MNEPTSPASRTTALVTWLERRARLVRISSFVLLLLAATSLLRLEIDVGLLSMLPRGRPAFDAYAEFVERFAERDSAIAIVRAPNAVKSSRFADLFAKYLAEEAAIEQVRGRIDIDDFLVRARDGAVARFTPLSSHSALAERLSDDGAKSVVRTLRGVLSMPGSVGVSAKLAADPFGLAQVLADALATSRPDRALAPGNDFLISSDGTRLLLLIQPRVSGYSLPEVEKFAEALDRAERRTRAALDPSDHETIDVAYTGSFAYAREDAAVMQLDLIRYTGIAFAGVLLIFFVGARSGRFLPLLGYHLLLGSLVTLAVGLVVLGRLDVISLAFAAIFYGVAVDAAIHLHTRFREELAAGREPSSAMAATLAHVSRPTLLASASTAMAFGLLGFASLEGVAQLGTLTAIGIVWNAFGTLVILPAFLLRRGVRWRDPGRAFWLAAVSRAVIRHRGATGFVLLVAAAFLAVGILRARLDTNLFALRPAGSQAARVQDEVEEYFGFTNPHGSVMVSIPPDAGEAEKDSLLVAVETVTRRLLALQESGEVVSVTSPAALLPSHLTQEVRLAGWRVLQRDAAADDLERELGTSGFRLEPFQPAISALRRVPEAISSLDKPLPGMEPILDHHVRRDAAGLGILVSYTPRDELALGLVATDLANELVIPEGVTLRVAGRPLLEQALRQALESEITFFLLAVFIATVVLLRLRERRLSAVLALVSLPTASVLATVGMAGWFGFVFTPVNVIVLPLVAGIALDDGLFLLERLREQGRADKAMERGGRALALTTATTMVGFGALALSQYPALAGLGSLAALGLFLAFLSMLFLLPFFLPDSEALH